MQISVSIALGLSVCLRKFPVNLNRKGRFGLSIIFQIPWMYTIQTAAVSVGRTADKYIETSRDTERETVEILGGAFP